MYHDPYTYMYQTRGFAKSRLQRNVREYAWQDKLLTCCGNAIDFKKAGRSIKVEIVHCTPPVKAMYVCPTTVMVVNYTASSF